MNSIIKRRIDPNILLKLMNIAQICILRLFNIFTVNLYYIFRMYIYIFYFSVKHFYIVMNKSDSNECYAFFAKETRGTG